MDKFMMIVSNTIIAYHYASTKRIVIGTMMSAISFANIKVNQLVVMIQIVNGTKDIV